MKKIGLFLSLLVLSFGMILPVSADQPEVSPIIGSWMLESVYENASGTDPVLLEPENAASLYSESKNVITFFEDGSFEATLRDGDGVFVGHGISWTAEGKSVRMKDEEGTEQDLVYDEETNTLHRYWKETAEDAMYHDLDFVYVRVPVGVWKMTQVFSTDANGTAELLDPETSASLYSESINLYHLSADGSALMEIGEEVSVEGTWERDHFDIHLSFDDDLMDLVYDPDTDTLHRYYSDEAIESMYHSLDFVYHRN